ncbi:hypothetical protein BGZ76_011858 [Entomortierella beljakovae]|nr:hypothetical protein BGZ76_011858 [Entomortierella beljakovae]
MSTTTTTTTATTATIASNTETSIAITTAPSNNKNHVVSEKTVDALGDWLLESASVHSSPITQEQRRKQSYKSSSIINKTMKQSQEERRRQALAEQAKKRYQFTNHARKLALFAAGKVSDASSNSADSDSQDNDEDEDDNDEDDDEDDDDNEDLDDEHDNTHGNGRKKKKRTSTLKAKDPQGNPSTITPMKPTAHKRRLSSGSESESLVRGKVDKIGDILSPKKPRLQKKNSSHITKRRKDRNPFRDQMMIPEALTDIPIDLDANYYIVPLPIGHRCFVISADGKTTARLPTGQLLVSAFESCLPAGSSQYRGNRRSDYCILDCVYSSTTRTFWTLDIMCWRGHPVYECETEFRFWWLRGKLAEIEDLQGKWIKNQTKEWELELEKKKQKRARQTKKRQERAAAAVAAVAMDVVPVELTDIGVQEEGDDGDDEAGIESMDFETRPKEGMNGSNGANTKKFWPVVFTPLPYFNASVNLVRLLAEYMHPPTPSLSPSSPPFMSSNGSVSSVPPVPNFSSVLESTATSLSKSKPITSFSKSHQTSIYPQTGVTCHSLQNNTLSETPATVSSTLGTMALSGEIATAASLFPAHDKTQIRTTPLCGWVSIEKIGDVFFDEEGGVGPVPGTSAVDGREVEMEDALERIRI